MHTFEIDFGGARPVTSIALYLGLSRGNVQAREYVVTVRAYRGDDPVPLESSGWRFSEHLKSTFCYIPAQEISGVVGLPVLVVRHELTHLRIEPRMWAKTAVPVSETIASAWAGLPVLGEGSIILEANHVV